MATPEEIYFEYRGQRLPNNSRMSLSQVGEANEAIVCKTEKLDCCGLPNRAGEFHYPNGQKVVPGRFGTGFYRNRGPQQIRLNRRNGISSPTGTFRCEIPGPRGTLLNIFITLF